MAASATSTEDWTTKEKFILSCCVSRSGDQNWVSVSRTMKLIMEACGDGGKRAPEWYSQKNCATKYNQLLNTAFAAKRKVRGTSSESINVETPAEQILRKLTFKRIEELDQAIKSERERYKKLKADIEKIQTGVIDDQLPQIWSAMQSGQTMPLEQLIKTEESEADTKTAAQAINTPLLVASQASQSRPQRTTKETERFKSYIEQRQKHNAKYHHHNPSSSTTPSSSATLTSSSATTSGTFTPDLSSLPTAVGPSPAQVQNITKSELSTVIPAKVLFIKNDQSIQEFPQQQQQQHPLRQLSEKLGEAPNKLIEELPSYQQSADATQLEINEPVPKILEQKAEKKQPNSYHERLQALQEKHNQQLLQQQQQQQQYQQQSRQQLQHYQQQQMQQLQQQQLQQRTQLQNHLSNQLQQQSQPQQSQQQQQPLQAPDSHTIQREVTLKDTEKEKLQLLLKAKTPKEETVSPVSHMKIHKVFDRPRKLEMAHEEHGEQHRKVEVESVMQEDELLAQQLREAEREFAFAVEEEEMDVDDAKEVMDADVKLENEEVLTGEKMKVDVFEATVEEKEDVGKQVTKPADAKEVSYLSTLLSVPATEIKARVSQLTETLKEPIKNPHHISKESYEAYKKAQPPSPSPVAPVLSKLLETSISPKISPQQNISKAKSTISPIISEKKISPRRKSIDETKGVVETAESTVPQDAVPSLGKPSNIPVRSSDILQVLSPTRASSIPGVVSPVRLSKTVLPIPPVGTNDDEGSSEHNVDIGESLQVEGDEDVALLVEGLSSSKDAHEESSLPIMETLVESQKISKSGTITPEEFFPKSPPIEIFKTPPREIFKTPPEVERKKSPGRSPGRSPSKSPRKSSHKVPLLKSISQDLSAKLNAQILATEEKSYEELGTLKDSLTVDVGEVEEIKVDSIVEPTEDMFDDESPANKRPSETLLEVVVSKIAGEEIGESPLPVSPTPGVSETLREVAEVINDPAIIYSPKFKKKKGRKAGRKKSLCTPVKLEILDDDIEHLDGGYLACKKFLDLEICDEDRKIKTPLTPSITSPASPALSIGSNGDLEVAHQQRAWKKSIMLVWKAAASHKYANIFLHPVTDEEAPGYSSIIYRPMDLSLIKKNIETGIITSTSEFQRDIMLMFQNALMYNRKEHDVYQMAQEMRDDVMEQIQVYLSYMSAQMMAQTADRDSKTLRGKLEAAGHTRHSAKSSFSFFSL